MKKLSTAMLAFTIAFGGLMTVGATEEKDEYFASENLNDVEETIINASGSFTSTGDVTVTSNPPTVGKVYYVVVNWESLDFTYDFGEAPTWNPLTHTYSSTNAVGWGAKTEATITVTNHSNERINSLATFANNQVSVTTYDVTARIDSNDQNIASAEGTAVLNPPTGTHKVLISGIPNKTGGEFTVGTITLKISPKPETTNP